MNEPLTPDGRCNVCGTPIAAAHAGEPQAGEKLCHDPKCPEAMVGHYNDRKNCVGYPPGGPEPKAGGGSVETAARSYKAERDAEIALLPENEQQIERIWQAMKGIDYDGAAWLTPRMQRSAERIQAEWDRYDSGGTTNETGKAPAPESMDSPQSNRQHAGEGKTAAKPFREGTPWSDYECLCTDPTCPQHERAPLVGREKESLD